MSVDDLPKVSVVIASYNMGEYLPLAVDSVLRQPYNNLEVVVVDDGSTDNTEQAMQRFASESKVKYIHQSNQGQPKAKNRGLKEAKGKFIAFCDADDLWAENKLSLQLPRLIEDPQLAVVASNVMAIDEHGVLLKRSLTPGFYGDLKERLLLENPIPFGTAIIRKSCLDDVGYFDENLPMGIDWDLWLRLSMRYKFLKINEPTYFYRHWSGQMSTNYEGRYDNADRILKKHFAAFPSEFSFWQRARAFADCDVSRAYHRVKNEGYSWGALRYLISGIVRMPFSVRIWRKAARALLKRT